MPPGRSRSPGRADPGTGGTRLGAGPTRHPGTMDARRPGGAGLALRQWRERLARPTSGSPPGCAAHPGPAPRGGRAARRGVRRLRDPARAGRGPHPSEAVLGALARALRLSAPSASTCSARRGQPTAARPDPGTVRPSVLRLLDRMHRPARDGHRREDDVLAWNPMARRPVGRPVRAPRARATRCGCVRRAPGHPQRHRRQGDAERIASRPSPGRGPRCPLPARPAAARPVDALYRSQPAVRRPWDSGPGRAKRVEHKTATIPSSARSCSTATDSTCTRTTRR